MIQKSSDFNVAVFYFPNTEKGFLFSVVAVPLSGKEVVLMC